MAIDPVLAVRQRTGETSPNSNWPEDQILEILLEATGDVNLASAMIWEAKAAALAKLTDVSENGSSRSQGKLYDNALAMADRFRKLYTDSLTTTGGVPTTRPTVTRPIERA